MPLIQWGKMKNNSIVWIESNGGPLILLPKNLLMYWNGNESILPKVQDGGTDENKSLNDFTDYDRACHLSDYINLISVGQAQGLVLGDMPSLTAWWPLPEINSGMLVRRIFANEDESIIHSLSHMSLDLFPPASFVWNNVNENLILMDSAFPGLAPYVPEMNRTMFTLPPGNFGIRTLEYGPDNDTFLILHLLESRNGN